MQSGATRKQRGFREEHLHKPAKSRALPQVQGTVMDGIETVSVFTGLQIR